MADTIIETVAEAIHRTLMATGRFATGYAYATAKTGARPTFNVWWAGFRDSGPEGRSAHQPTTTTFQYIVEVRDNLTADAEGAQRRLMGLVTACRDALMRDNRLGPTRGVLRSRLISGSVDIDTETDQAMLVAQLIIEVDYAGAWVAP